MEPFVANIDYGMDACAFKTLASQYGKLAKCVLALDKETGESLGYGFVAYFMDRDTRRALEQMNEIYGLAIVISSFAQQSGPMHGIKKGSGISRSSEV